MDKKNVKSWRIGLVGFVVAFMLIGFAGRLMASAQSSEKREKKFGLSLKLSGGLGYLLDGAGDINQFRKGLQGSISDSYTGEGYTKNFDWSRPWLIPDFSAEIIFHLGSHFGFGFGTGIIHGSSNGGYSINYHKSTTLWETPVTFDSQGDQKLNQRITAVPVKFDLYYFQSLGRAKKLGFFAHAGVGYYHGKAKFDYPYTSHSEDVWDEGDGASKYESDYQEDINGNAKCDTWGYHGGLGLELKLSRMLSFGAELFGRYVNFKNWNGDLSYTWKETYKDGDEYGWWSEGTESRSNKFHGSLWTYQIHNGENNKDYTYMMLFEKKPTESQFKNLRTSAINLNSLGLVLSANIRFDLF